MRLAHWFTGFKQCRGIVEWFAASLIPIDKTDEQGGCAQTTMEPFQRLKIFGNETRFENQVLRRVSGDREFRSQNQFRTGCGKAFIGVRDLLKISAQIPDGQVELSLGLMGQIDNRAMLIASVQGIVGPFHEDLCPLQHGGGEESGNRAKNDLLKESGMHLTTFESTQDASLEWGSPESPLLRFHDPESEEEVGHGMAQYAGRKAPRAISDAVIKYAGQQRGRPIRRRMGEAEAKRYDCKRKPREGPETHVLEILIDKKPKQKPAPKNFLDKWNNDNKAEKSEHDYQPVKQRLRGKDVGIETQSPR